jgi:hypothetical protein
VEHLLKKQWDHCYAQEAFDDEGNLTMWALGGFVPEEEEQAKLHLQANPPYRGTPYGPRGNFKVDTVVRLENDFRLNLLGKMNDFLDSLRATNCSIRRSCKVSGLNRTMVESLKLRCSDFAKAWKDVYEEITDKLEEEGFRRAVEGVEQDVFANGVVVGTKTVYSDSLLALMLQGRRSDVYRNKTATELSGPNGAPVELAALSDEQLDAMLKAKMAEAKIKGLLDE